MRKNWTQDEIEYLEKNYETKSIKLIAKNLDRSYNSVVLKIKRLGLSLKGDENYINIADFCDLTGISRSTIEYWIRNVSFPTKKTGKYRKIRIDTFWKWASENKSIINWKSFHKDCLPPEPNWVDILRTKNDSKSTRRDWTTQEEQRLKDLLAMERYTYQEIANLLNRTHGAIKRKIYDLKLLHTPVYTDKHRLYSDDEIETIINLKEAGYTISTISLKVNRSEAGIREKIRRIAELTRNGG